MPVVNVNPRGSDFVRLGVAKALADIRGENPYDIACSRWGAGSAPSRVLRGLVPGMGFGDVHDDAAVSGEFFDIASQLSIPGQMPGIRRTPLNVRLTGIVSGSIAYWSGEGRSKPVSKPVFAIQTLAPLKVSSLIIVTRELLETTDPAGEASIRRDMLRGISEAVDLAFTDPSNSGTPGVSPASITDGITPIPATADPHADLTNLIADFQGDLTQAVFVMKPEIAASLAGADYPDIGLKGGSLLGAPALTSNMAADGMIALIDSSAVAFGAGPAELKTSRQASIEMRDDPTMSGDSPVTSTTVISTFQVNAVALLYEQTLNWSLCREGGVSVLTGCDY